MKLLFVTAVYLLLLTSTIYCQFENDSTDTKEDLKEKIPVTLRNFSHYPDYLIFNSSNDFTLPVYFNYQSDEVTSSLNLDMKKINSQLLNNFRQKMAWQENQDLGVLGQYLGYAMSAAAAGLAITHIVKYKEKAWIGK